jgi:putative ABC transport system permease protein
MPPIRSQLTRLDPEVPLADVRTMDQLLDESLTQQRFRGLLIGGFAGMALALAATGLYGVISYFVTQRTHEIGLRMALGAQRSDVLRLVIRQAVQIALIGIAIGLSGAFAVTRMLKSLLFGISPSDSFSFLLTTIVLALVVLLGSYVPARRAMNVDPMESLRYE